MRVKVVYSSLRAKVILLKKNIHFEKVQRRTRVRLNVGLNHHWAFQIVSTPGE